jgi:hypothetical protein
LFNEEILNAPLVPMTLVTDNNNDFELNWPKLDINEYARPFNEWSSVTKFYSLAWFTSIEEELELVDNFFNITSTYPNPFNPSTQVQVNLSQAVELRLAVYDVLGRKVQSWQTPQRFASGSHQITLDFSGLASGTYVIELLGTNLVNGQVSRQTTRVSLVK